MKKNTVLYVLLAAAGVYLLTSAKPKARGYTITVPEPEKISESEYNKAVRRQRALETARKAVELARKLAEKKLRQKQLGNFY